MSRPGPAAGRRRGGHGRRLAAALFGVLAAGLMAAFFLQALTFEAIRPPEPTAQRPASPHGDGRRISVGTSRYSGFDRQHQPYRIEAKAARQDEANARVVILDDMQGRLRKPDGREFELAARQAMFDTQTKALDLDGDVMLVLSDTFRASLEAARVMVEDKSLTSQSDVVVTFSGGRIESTGVEISDDGSRVLFRNRVRVRIEGDGNKGNRQQ